MDYDICVIGAGPGGYVAAIRAAQLGLKTVVVERAKAGGICTSVGCIPSKTLLHGAGLLHAIRHAKEFGILVGEPKIDFKALRSKKNRVIDRLVKGVEFLLKKNGVDWIAGEAKLESRNKISVTVAGGTVRAISATNIIISTGARPIELPHLKPDGQSIITYVEALEVDGPPKEFVVIGGGAIGLEMAEVYAAFGSNVTVVELLPQLLPGFDADLSQAATDALKTSGVKTLTATKVTDAKQARGGRWTLKLETADGKSLDSLTADKVLVAVGLRPNSESLGLQTAGVATDQRGFITVDDQMRTNIPNIFAIGDVTGRQLLAHKASREAHVAAEVCAGRNVVMDYRSLPGTVFLHPEIATVGLTENAAKEAGYDLIIGKFPLTALGRGVATGATAGFVKIIVDKESDLILGVHIVSPTAGDMIAEGALAIAMDATAEDLSSTIHVHPTFSESMMESAADAHGESVHMVKK